MEFDWEQLWQQVGYTLTNGGIVSPHFEQLEKSLFQQPDPELLAVPVELDFFPEV